MNAKVDIDIVWVPVSEFAREFQKCSRTIIRWCINGFIIELGHRVKRDPTGHWLIGVSRTEHARWNSSKQLQYL